MSFCRMSTMGKFIYLATLMSMISYVWTQQPSCMFDTCVVIPDFCQNGGTCIHNSTDCTSSCVCVGEYTGRRCQQRVTFDELKDGVDSGKPSGGFVSNCFVNPCSEQLAAVSCRNGGSCTVNPGTCQFTCVCAAGYAGRNCEQESSSNMSARTCGTSGLQCIHGICVQNSTNIDNLLQNKSCVCEDGWIGKLCDLKLSDNSTSPEEIKEFHLTSNLSTQTTVNPIYNVCSDDYIERSRGERTCNGMFWGHECMFGVCQKEISQDETWRGYAYTCECDHGAQGTYCDYKCCLNCGEQGTCAIVEHPNSTTSEFCDCKPNYDGEWCEIYVPEPFRIQLKENTWYLYVVGACAVTFIILVIMAVVIPYWMWKHRVILIMKIVHYFKPYEDEDDRQWDAFVSYKADEVDEGFVVHTLYPKLEKELGYKLCLHFRDFVPGETIANNIINAVEGSRRTILILTPRYVESEFTRFEYEKAQQEMLRRKHRIIPLMLEDISGIASNMDKTLKSIIESVTYLEWPESNESSSKKMDKFWKRLYLSMPKKKESVSSSSTGNCSSFSPSSGHVISDNIKGSPRNGAIVNIPPSSCSFFDAFKQSNSGESGNHVSSSTDSRTYSSSGESEDTVYTEISEIDMSLNDVIPTLSEEQEHALSVC